MEKELCSKLCMPNACIQCFKINISEAGHHVISFLEGQEHQYRSTAKERTVAWQEEARPWQAFMAGIFSPVFLPPGSTLAQPGQEEWGEVGVTHHRSRRAQTPRRTRGRRAPPWPPSWPLAASSLQRREGTRLAECRDLPTAANAGRGAGDSCSSTENRLYDNVSCSKRLEISFVPSPFNTCLKTRLLKAFAFLLQHRTGCGDAAGEQ